MTVCVLLAHGSPDPRSASLVHETAARVAERLGAPVGAAFLDHDAPDLRAAVADVADHEDVVVLPLLLSTAFHARVDVPAAVAALDRDVRLLEPLGHPAALLDDLLRGRATPVVVVAAGTSVAEEREAFRRAVVASSGRTRVPATAAFATGPGRRIADATRPGAAIVVPWLLAPGRLLDSVHEAATSHACATSGDGLLREPGLLDVLVARLRLG